MDEPWRLHEESTRQIQLVARSGKCPNVAICDENRKYYGVQFHPEVNHTENGTTMIRNFLYKVCGAVGDWTMEAICIAVSKKSEAKQGMIRCFWLYREAWIPLCVQPLFAEAVGSQLTCVFVDHGLVFEEEGKKLAGRTIWHRELFIRM